MALTSSVSGAASGIVASILTAAAGATLDSLKPLLTSYMGKNMGVAYALQRAAVADYYMIVESSLEADYKIIIDSLKAGIGQGVGATHAGLAESLLGSGNLLAVYNAVIHQEAIAPYLARWARSSYRPAIPDTPTAFTMLKRGSIKADDYVKYARYEGWDDALRVQLESSFYTIPGLTLLNELFWRGKIDDGAWTRAVRGQLYDDAMTEALKVTREVIPPLPDLIDMAVKEAFPVEPGKPQFEAMRAWAAMRGLSSWWVDRYWLKHFFRMDVSRAVDNWCRGFWDEARLRRHLLLMDQHPDDHDAIIRVAYSVPSRIELRHGWETGVYSDEEIEKFMRWRRLSPEDAVKSAEALKEYALHEERMGVLREWLSDFVDGLITEATLRANMTSIKILGVRQDYYVARSKVRRERNYKRRILDLYEDGYLKDLLTDEELENRINEIIVDRDAATLRYQEAWIKKYRKPPATPA